MVRQRRNRTYRRGRRRRGPWRCIIDEERVSPRVGSRSRNAEFAKWIFGRKCTFSRILRPNVPRRGRRPPPKRVFWVLYSSLESSRGVTTSHSAWDGSPTGCHNPAGRYNGIPRPLVCVAAGERRKGDRERRRLYLYSRSAISRSTAHDETRRRHLCYCSNE